MLIFGWGKKFKSWEIKIAGQNKKLTCVYSYLSVFVFFRLITNKRWFVLGEKRSEDQELTSDQAKKFFVKIPPFNIFEQYGLLILFGLIFLCFGLGLFK